MICIVSNCDREVSAKKMCKKHYNKVCYHKNKDKYSVWCKNYRESEKGKIAYKKWNLKNRKQYNQKTKVKQQKKEWEQRNSSYRSFYNLYRNLLKEQACPKWIDYRKIKEIYEKCPENMTVDHIIPLHNEKICGLRVPWNLQYLS